ncbi:ATP-binding protein [Vibrio algicola]|uniref:histidine kinase n=1 Tax=Vibrio algicola TaxID=2662262 RepID=A0A5Q0TJ02_9VIBR|nr:ATP-binding protein [Vibrio algicola]
MKRIYLECFVGLVLHLCLILVGYNFIVYDLNVDYDYLLEDFEGQGLHHLVGNIYHNQGEEAALAAVASYAKTTRQTLSRPDRIPNNVTTFFSFTSPQSHTFHDDDRVLWFRFTLNNDIYSLRPDMSTSLRQSIEFDDDILWVFFIGGFSVYSVLFIWFLGRRVRALEKATLSFANGGFETRVSEKSNAKVGSLNRNFNYMADKISALIYTNKALTNAVAHELRTPIFRIQWQAELLSDEILPIEQKKKIISIIEDIDEMETMVSQLLYYAKAERADVELNKDNIDIYPWISNIADKWRSSNGARIEMLNDTPSNQEDQTDQLECDPYILTQALNNLLSNANKHCQSVIYLSYQLTQHTCTIIVEDDGAGIEPRHWPFIFDAFYSADSSRNKQQVGFGLGLAIVKQIALLHKGEVQVSASQHGGAKFTLRLPQQS